MKISNDDLMNQQPLMIAPMDPYTRDFIFSVDRRSKGDIMDKFGVYVTMDYECSTITYIALQEIINYVRNNLIMTGKASSGKVSKNDNFNFYNLLVFTVTNKKNKKAEKEGNLNIKTVPGPDIKRLIEGEDLLPIEAIEPEAFFKIDAGDPIATENINDRYSVLERKIRFTLASNRGIIIPDKKPMTVFAIVYTYIVNLFSHLLYTLKDDEDKMVSLNFMDILEFHSIMDDNDNVSINICAGYKSKLSVKSDEYTEDDIID